MSSVNGANIQNAGTNLYADIDGGNTSPGAVIIIFTLNQQGGTRNQDWRFVPVNAGRNLFAIQSVLTGGYISVDEAKAGQALKTNDTSIPWQVTIVDTWSRNFTVKLPNTNLVWSVPAGSGPITNITLADAVNGNTNQQWKLTTL